MPNRTPPTRHTFISSSRPPRDQDDAIQLTLRMVAEAFNQIAMARLEREIEELARDPFSAS